MIAAAINNSEGIAGMAFPAQLIIAKIARSDQSIDVRDEAEAIRWAVDVGARVINLSIGGLRDPFNPKRDTFSRVERARSLRVSVRRRLVAAVGNSDDAASPWTSPLPWQRSRSDGVERAQPDRQSPQLSNPTHLQRISEHGPESTPLASSPDSLRHLGQNQGTRLGSDDFPQRGGGRRSPRQGTQRRPSSSRSPALQQIRSEPPERTRRDLKSERRKQCPLYGQRPAAGEARRREAVGALEGVLPPPDGSSDDDEAARRSNWHRVLRQATIDFWTTDRLFALLRRTRSEAHAHGPKAPLRTGAWNRERRRLTAAHHISARAQSIGTRPEHGIGYKARRGGSRGVQAHARGFGPTSATRRR